MRIDDTSGVAGAQAMNQAATGGAAKVTHPPPGEAVDRADVSPVAELAQGADPQRLEALRGAVASGTYRVSANDLARSILDAHLKP